MSSSEPQLVVRAARPEERDTCVSLWVQACDDRDGHAIEGTAEIAQAKFDRGVSWLVAEDQRGLAGFVFCTEPRSELPTDPPDAAVISMLAVAPDHQGLGVGKSLLKQALVDLARQGHRRAVLHVFIDNPGAVHLYERNGWQPFGDEIMIDPLGHRPSRTYSYTLSDRRRLAAQHGTTAGSPQTDPCETRTSTAAPRTSES